MNPDHRLDVSGLRCPVPLLMTARCVDALEPGERLLVTGDDPELELDVRRWCTEAGHRLVHAERAGNAARCLIEKGDRKRSKGNLQGEAL